MLWVVAVGLFALVAAVCDARTKRLPNWLTVPAIAAGVVFHIVVGSINGTGAIAGLGHSIGGFATGFGLLLVLFLVGGGGAGDVKLMGAVGAWMGAWLTLCVFLLSAVFVILLSAAVLMAQMLIRGFPAVRRRYLSQPDSATKRNKKRPRGTSEERLHRRTRRRILPYGVPVAFATWCVLGWEVWSRS